MIDPQESLYEACVQGDLEQAKDALKAGASPDSTGGWALQCAAEKGYESIVRLLVKNGADPNGLDDRALISALGMSRTAIVNFLAPLMKPGNAWLGDPEVKKSRIDRAKWHKTHDLIVADNKYYDEDGNVCAITCSLPDSVLQDGDEDYYRQWEIKYSGLTYSWLWLQERLFEGGTSTKEADATFAVESLESLPVGANPNLAVAAWAEWRQKYPDAGWPAQREAFITSNRSL